MTIIINQIINSLIGFGILMFAYYWGKNIAHVFKLTGLKLNSIIILVGIGLGLLGFFSNNLISNNRIASVLTIEIIYVIGIANRKMKL